MMGRNEPSNLQLDWCAPNRHRRLPLGILGAARLDPPTRQRSTGALTDRQVLTVLGAHAAPPTESTRPFARSRSTLASSSSLRFWARF